MKSVASLLLGLALMVPSLALSAFQEGQHYRALNTDAPPGDEPLEVTEFFWYGCGACYRFAPMVEAWKEQLGDDVVFRRVPIAFNPRWQAHTQAFYTAESLGVTEQVHDEIFRAIHQQGNMLDSRDAVEALFVAQGVDADEFRASWGSFSVDSQIRRAGNLARRYQVRATPSIVVGGHYVSDPSSAGGLQELLELTDHLIEQLNSR